MNPWCQKLWCGIVGARKECLPSVAHGMFARGGVELALYFYESSNQQLVSWLIEQQTDGEK